MSYDASIRLSVLGPPRTQAAIIAILAARASHLSLDPGALQEPEKISKGVAVYRFCAYRSSPTKFVEHLSSDWPAAVFALSWIDYGSGYGRVLVAVGAIEQVEILPAPFYMEDYEAVLASHDAWVAGVKHDLDANGRLRADYDE